MTTNQTITPKVFISYSHDSPGHTDRVLKLSDRLRTDGIECVLDQYESSPPEGWARWMDKHIKESDFVLMVCTETYYQRVIGTEKPGTGLGVRWEGNLIYQHIYNAGTLNTRFIPVLFDARDSVHIPTPMQGSTYYLVPTEDGYEDLYRRITNQPRIVRPKLGKLRQLPPRERKQDFFALPWNVPYERNPYFTGRNHIIAELADALSTNRVGALTQAVSGLGGIGKTQIAVEYAYRYRDKYKAVFWIMADTTLNLSSGFFEIAKMLNLPEKDAQDSNEVVGALNRWLENHSGWLLIFDNADNPEMVKEFRPLDPKGHILLTSRAQVFDMLGISRPIEVNEMPLGEALEFLFKRTGRKTEDGMEKEAAAKLAKELGYLPLALEQAAAYMTAKKARFQDYFASYLNRRLDLLERSMPVAGDYKRSVSTTWAMNFSEVEKESKAAADLLRVSAFLSPDSIPLELILKGASQMGDPLFTAVSKAKGDILAINEILEPLTTYSLVRRDINGHAYGIHPLVQEVLKHEMSSVTQKLWAERVVRALGQAFPAVEFVTWTLCDRLLPHAKAAAALIKHYGLDFQEAGRLLNQAACYLRERGKYVEAEPLYKLSLTIYEKALGANHVVTAETLNNLAVLYHDQGKYTEAVSLLKRCVLINERALGANHPGVAISLNNLAELYRVQGKYAEVEPMYKRALAIRRNTLGPEHPDVAVSLNNLALLYRLQARYAEAEPLLRVSLAINEKALGPDHPAVALSLNNLAVLLYNQGKYSEAGLLYKRALEIRESTLGPEHLDVAAALNNLAELYRVQGKDAEVEPLYKRALAIRRNRLGPEHPDVAVSFNNLAQFYVFQGRYAEAEPLLRLSLAINEKALGPDHPGVALSLNNLAALHKIQCRYAEAEPLYKRALAIRENVLGPEHPDVAEGLNNLAMLYQEQGKYVEAELLCKQSLDIWEKALGPEHPNVATSLENYAGLLSKVNRVTEAKRMVARAKKIRDKQAKAI